MASSAPSTHGRWAPSLTRVWGPRWPAACLANANTQPATPHPPVEHKCTLSKRRARECSWPVYLEATMSTGVQIRSHSRTSGHHGQRKGRAALPVGGPPGPRQWGSVCTIMSGLAEPLLPRNRVAQDTGLGRSWGQPRGLDWLAGHVHQTRGRHPSPPRALKTYFHREQRARKQAEMGARPAETPTVPLPVPSPISSDVLDIPSQGLCIGPPSAWSILFLHSLHLAGASSSPWSCLLCHVLTGHAPDGLS